MLKSPMSRNFMRTFAIITALALFALPSNIASSDPMLLPQDSGISYARWDFAVASDYSLDNVTLSTNSAELAWHEASWDIDTQGDFANGTLIGLDISPAGVLTLGTTPVSELLANSDFTGPDNGWSEPAADNWTAITLSDAISAPSTREPVGGLGDGLYCWRNRIQEFDPAGGYMAEVWLNQTFSLPSMPLTIDVSAYHRFLNNTNAIGPGSLAEIWITELASGSVNKVCSSGYVNSSYADYLHMVGNCSGAFPGPGAYNLTLYTFTDTRGNPGNTCPTGVDNLWDNASVKFGSFLDDGIYVSDVFDAGSFTDWKNLYWTEQVPPGTSIELCARTGNSSVPTDSIWSPWSAQMTDCSGSVIPCPRARYIQLRAELRTTTTDITPSLCQIRVTFEKHRLTGSVETGDLAPANFLGWGFMTHSEELRGQSVNYMYSTDSGITWTEVPADGDLRDHGIQSGHIRLKGLLQSTDTVVTPTLQWLAISFISVNPAVTVQTSWSSTGVSPGENIRLYVYFNNTADSASAAAWINVYLDESLEYLANNTESVAGFGGYITDPDPGIRKYVFSDIAATSSAFFWIDARLKSGSEDGDVLQTTVTLDCQDPLGSRLESILKIAQTTVEGPNLELELATITDSADVGDNVQFMLFVNNTGRGAAAHTWINGTLDESLGNANISLEMDNMPGGSARTATFNSTLAEKVAQGSTILTQLEASYADSSGYVRTAATNTESLTARLKSRFSLSVSVQSAIVNSGEMTVMTVHFNNTGYGRANSVKLNFTVPEGLEFVSSSENCIQSSGECRWEMLDVGPGAHSFTVTLRGLMMGNKETQCSIAVKMQVADSVEGLTEPVASEPVGISVVRIYTFWEEIYWPWSGIAAATLIAAAAIGLWYVYKPVPPSIDDAFVIYRDGRLISHRKSVSGKDSGLDGDLVGAMLTAVQDFVSDSLSKGKADKVKKLEFGDRELYLERGDNINLVLIYSGSLLGKLETQAKELVEKIEKEHPFLGKWDGRMAQLADVNPQLDALIARWQTLSDD